MRLSALPATEAASRPTHGSPFCWLTTNPVRAPTSIIPYVGAHIAGALLVERKISLRQHDAVECLRNSVIQAF
jgi:hypothetical protein